MSFVSTTKAWSAFMLIVALFFTPTLVASAQCVGCTQTLSSNSSSTFNLSAGNVLCILPGVRFSGQINLNGGKVCNQGIIDVSSMNFNSGEIDNYGTFKMNSQLSVNGTFNNRGSLNINGSVIVNSNGALSNYIGGTISVNGSLTNNKYFYNEGSVGVSGNFSVNSSATLSENRGTITVAGNIELNNHFRNYGNVKGNGMLTVNSSGSITNLDNATVEVKGNYVNNSTTTNDGRIFVEGSLTNNSSGLITNNDDIEILGNFVNNGHLTGDAGGCNIFTVAGSTVLQNGSGVTNNVDFCALAVGSGRYSTNFGSIGAGTTFCACSRSSITPLPIVLTKLSAECLSSEVLISWTTASEINNSFFTISKSENAINWEPVGIVSGAGNSNVEIEYSFIDERPFKGTGYYRLHQTDFDGTTEYFSPVSVSCDASLDITTVNIFPNPADAEFTVLISSSNTMNAIIEIVDLSGKIVLEKAVAVNYGENALVFDRSGLLSGIYVVKVFSNERVLEVGKLILR